MIHFTIPNISCGHCVRAVTSAIAALDPAATVDVNIAAKSVAVETTAAQVDVAAALAAAGYQPEPG
jgi:copper chaperone